MKKLLFFLSIALSLKSISQINTAKLDSFFSILSEKNKAMGCVAVFNKGKLAYTKAIGYKDEKKSKPANEDTKYRIGSITKMFTAVVVFQLIEEKKLTLNTTLNKFYPTIKNANIITIENLLHHSSGIENITEENNYLSWCDKPISEKEMISKISGYNSEFKPSEKVKYSNSNYILLSYIIQKITKKSYAENIDERIVNKLNLKNTKYGGKINTNENEAKSFILSDKELKLFETETDMSVPSGAGAIISTPKDLCIFITALFNKKLINENSLNKMKTIDDGMGYGMFSFPFGSKKAFGHTGGIDGFNSMLGYFPNDSLAFCYISNGQNYAINDIAIGVLSICFNKTFVIPTFETKNVDIDLSKLIGTYKSKDIPLKMTISTDGKNLIAQATGQSSFTLSYNGNRSFVFNEANIELLFNEENKMTLKQSGLSFNFIKE